MLPATSPIPRNTAIRSLRQWPEDTDRNSVHGTPAIFEPFALAQRNGQSSTQRR